ncbi:MAG: M14 metallopeptidase family protein [Daejeonella sp.]
MEILKPFSKYQEKSINNRFFKHADVQKLIQNLDSTKFKNEVIGKSVQGRNINLLKYGNGKLTIFLWSQMHGDEATATMALFDLFNFLQFDDELNPLRESIENNCTLYFIPMVNPDGAEVFTRRNAQGIDINRDFLKRQSPEGKLLAETRDRLNPDFGFNLHDQGVIWSAGRTGNPATISLLAPAFDEVLTVDQSRLKAMQVISVINEDLQKIIPHHVGRFNDEYEPRAFGDNFQSLGTSTILIEAGGYADDHEKQFIRQVFFKSLLTGLESIANNTYPGKSKEHYFSIPENQKLHFRILLKNCSFNFNDLKYISDVGLIAEEEINEDLRSVNYTYKIEDLGDLNSFNGYEIIECSGLVLTLINPLVCGKNADFVLRDGLTTILCVENGRITDKNL